MTSTSKTGVYVDVHVEINIDVKVDVDVDADVYAVDVHVDADVNVNVHFCISSRAEWATARHFSGVEEDEEGEDDDEDDEDDDAAVAGPVLEAALPLAMTTATRPVKRVSFTSDVLRSGREFAIFHLLSAISAARSYLPNRYAIHSLRKWARLTTLVCRTSCVSVPISSDPERSPKSVGSPRSLLPVRFAMKRL